MFTGSIKNLTENGRPKLLDEFVENVQQLLLRSPIKYVWIAACELHLSISSVRLILKNLEYESLRIADFTTNYPRGPT